MFAATRSPRHAVAVLLVLALVTTVAPAAAAPDAVPDRVPLLSEPVGRASLVLGTAPDKMPSQKSADGEVADWVGEASGIGGTARLDAGEHVYTDFLFDDWGADDGGDAERLSVLGPLREAESRTARLDQLFQAAGDQFGAPPPFGALDHYGDGQQTEAADLREVRWAAEGDTVHFLARTTTMKDDRLGVLLLADTDGTLGKPREVGFGTGLTTQRFDTAILLSAGEARLTDLNSGASRLLAAPVVLNADGWTNALEAALPASVFGDTFDVAVVSGLRTAEGIKPANVAYRFDEPVAGVYNDQRQALELYAGSVDDFTADIDLTDLRSGASQTARPGPGYSERQMVSAENISRERGESGIWQPYGLYVPRSYQPAKPTPLTFWLHYRGGKAHSGGAWTPRLLTQLGEETANIVVTPRGRGTSTWYVTEAHQDFFEVFSDVHGLMNIDQNRRYLSGYSMGGYGTYLFGLLYPDLFAAGYSTSGAVTQGAWTGDGPDSCTTGQCYVEANGGDADAQLTYRILENARQLPLTIHHGTNDELVPVTGVQRMGVRLAELGYRYDLTMFHGYEHFTQAIVDEWADGAAYMQQFTRDPNPRTVTYKVVPALVGAVNTVTADGVAFAFNPDGAYWTDDIVVRDGDPKDPAVSGQVDATSEAIAAQKNLATPRTGVFSPLGQSTTYTRHGLDWLEVGGAETLRNAFSATLRNVESASLDAARMRLDPAQVIAGAVTSDGPATLTLTNVNRAVEVVVGGVSQGVAQGDVPVRLVSGANAVQLRPAG